jgi:hypothetical protein
MLECSPTPKANIAPPPTQFLERALGDRPDPCKPKAEHACDSDLKSNRDTIGKEIHAT